MLLPLVITAVVGYLLGALPFGYWLAKAKGVNIMEVGSRNPGATNVKRVLGAKAGNTVFLLDALKGFIATAIPLLFQLGGPAGSSGYDLGGVIGVAAAVLGHSFSCFIGFRGGKGVATAAGGLFVLMPLPCVIAGAAWVATFFISRYVSLASIVAALVIATLPWFLSFGLIINGVATLLGLLVIARHHANISRLLAGTEHRWDRK
ncbi:glycerol-3-phosphate 1-O-acyltransferase PlsY [Synoicihabitans lomoniglobus]|uniref:Glycerol-3-phosphate acyltransferase n=1 Tax=Synoicihabitans lomoniglobus TaxID=2909285 RepID=A0AAF0CR28_9BACT|nr:glycerol-3-phosphate 1-O-acyltransferase PlsY [Opitutaceae bacterium LMO-M01]WED66512.1 glycerol-3-phosphate 1-O-acyltransferase PlsY [Opitutaceae bacterium LMO-M01]